MRVGRKQIRTIIQTQEYPDTTVRRSAGDRDRGWQSRVLV